MNILVLSDEIYPDGIGGIGKSAFNECAALVRRGHNVTVFVRSLDRRLPAHSIIDGISIVRFQGPERDDRFYRFYPFATVIQGSRWLRKNGRNFDVIMVYNPFFIVAALLAGLKGHVPLLYTFYSFISAEISISSRTNKYGRLGCVGRVAATILFPFERWAFSRLDLILPRSRYSARALRNSYQGRNIIADEAIIPLGVDTGRYKASSQLMARQHLGLPTDRPLLITVRRLEGRMGLFNLIDAVKLIQKRYPTVLSLIAGRGYLKDDLERHIEDMNLQGNIQLLGFVDENDLPIYLAAADLFVLPTEMLEGFGLATVEALAVGTPAIGTPIGATPEVLGSIDPDMVSQGTRAVDIAEAVELWLGNPQRLANMRQVCLSEVALRYSADSVAERLERLIDSVLTDNGFA